MISILLLYFTLVTRERSCAQLESIKDNWSFFRSIRFSYLLTHDPRGVALTWPLERIVHHNWSSDPIWTKRLVCLTISLYHSFIYSFVCLSVHWLINWFILPSFLPSFLPFFPSFFLSSFLSFCLSFFSISSCLSFCLSVFLSFSPSLFLCFLPSLCFCSFLL